MADRDRIEHRLAAVERAVVDGDYDVDQLADQASLRETVEHLETQVTEHEQRLADLEARTESLSGYVGNVHAVNDDVERRAASAVATVDRLESRIEELEDALEAVREEATVLRGTERPKALEAGEPDASHERRRLVTEDTRANGDDDPPTPAETATEIVTETAADGDRDSQGTSDDGGDDDGRPDDQSGSGLLGAVRSKLH
ncbi:DUF7310 family coiled-coil domain-containing protein [Natrialbaceae archaeon A-gly3]